MSNLNEVAVVSVNYFGADDTRACLGSMLSDSKELRIVVVDNSPSDPGLRGVKAEFSSYVKFIDSDLNRGFGGGNNLGIDWILENTKCKYILLLNNDARAQRGAVDKLVNCLQANAELGAVGGLILVDGSDEVWFGSGEVDFARGGGRRCSSSKPGQVDYVPSEFLSGAVMMIRRSVLEVVGGFDPVFFMYEEDIDLSLRIREAGWSLGVCWDAKFYHRVHGSQSVSSDTGHIPRWSPLNPNFDFLVYHNVRNNIINIRKHVRYSKLVNIFLVYPFWLAFKTLNATRGRGFSAVRTVCLGIRDGLSQSLRK
ncbi:glycosyltransferase [Sulfitobacter sp. JBTF-M27]|uniref:Glycosyltransferase n=1 Tax=Sulfitobacter sediminilitoris TaxID=2698830 RepID=A0A6P0CG18_9RHOB|nr:glycosyltransferase family 2 protein [Sulfitobacter sediminilitoris]NEK25089.1 glycosyltransferase [Sulfitobacter sediminilitoris]